MDSLIPQTNLRGVRDALAKLPAGVNTTYDEAMERIGRQDGDDRMLAERILAWVTCAYRPLSLRELQHALAVSPRMTHVEPDALVDETILTSVCAGLVVIDENTNIVRFVRKYSSITSCCSEVYFR